MATTCTFLQLCSSQNPNFTPFSSSRSLSFSNPTRRSLPLSFASSKAPFHSRISAKHISSIENDDSTDSVDSVVNPSVKHANVLFFRSAYNVQILVDEEESEEVLLRRFRREVSKAGVIQECKRRRFFENKQEEKKRKAREAGRRNRRRRLGPRFSSPTRPDTVAPKQSEEDDDNWEMPKGRQEDFS